MNHVLRLSSGLLAAFLSAALGIAAEPAPGPAAPNMLWQIGQGDGKNGEFALAPDRYEAFEEDGLFVVGRSEAKAAWQFIETWDRQAGKLLQEFTPYPNTYFGLGLLSRFTAKHSAVLACRVEGGTMQKWQRVFAAALRSPQGHLTLAVVNDAPQEFDLALELEGLAEARRFYRYGITAQDRDRADVKIAPQREFPLSTDKAALRDQLAPRSVTVYSTYQLTQADPGIVAE